MTWKKFGNHYIMVYALIPSILLVIVCLWLICRRAKRSYLSCVDYTDSVRNRLVKLDINFLKKLAKNMDTPIFRRILHEVEIFNRLNVVMPCRKHVPVMYIDALHKLHRDPRWITLDADTFAKLMYLYAAATLYKAVNDFFIKKQLIKNCICIFGKTVIKKSIKLATITDKLYFNRFQPVFKLLFGGVTKIVGGESSFTFEAKDIIQRKSFSLVFSRSYAIHYGGGVKHYVDDSLPAEGFEILGQGRFIWKSGLDKLRCTISHTSDVFYVNSVSFGKNLTLGVYVVGKKSFGSNLTDKSDNLDIHIEVDGGAKVFIIRGETRSDVTQHVLTIRKRGNRLNYLRSAEIEETQELFMRSYNSHFVSGEDLYEKYRVAARYVPTLFTSTLVYNIESVDSFFAVIDAFPQFHKIVHAGINLNVICLYSSLDDSVRTVINSYTDCAEVKELISSGVFVFFLDKMKLPRLALNYFCLMQDASTINVNYTIRNEVDNKNVIITESVSKGFPVTYTYFVRNTSRNVCSTKVRLSLDVSTLATGVFVTPAIVKRQHNNLWATNLRTGRTASYKLPAGAKIFVGMRELLCGEAVCERLEIKLEVKLKPFEEKVLEIVKNENALTLVARKKEFFVSITDIKVRAERQEVNRIFALNVNSQCKSNVRWIEDIKRAVRDKNSSVFFALFAGETEMSTEAWTILVDKVLGIKLIAGKIQLCPSITITGNFEVAFDYKGQSYKFNVREQNNGFSVRYDEVDYKNFLVVG